MTKNKIGGKAFKKGKKGKTDFVNQGPIPEADTPTKQYAQAIKILGGSRVQVTLNNSNNQPVQAIIPGSMYKRVWIRAGDILLVELHNELLKSNECHILYKYTPAEAHTLKSKNVFTFTVQGDGDDDNIRFGDEVEEVDEDSMYNAVENAIDKSKAARKHDKKLQEEKRSADRYKKIMGIRDDEIDDKPVNLDDI